MDTYRRGVDAVSKKLFLSAKAAITQDAVRVMVPFIVYPTILGLSSIRNPCQDVLLLGVGRGAGLEKLLYVLRKELTRGIS